MSKIVIVLLLKEKRRAVVMWRTNYFLKYTLPSNLLKARYLPLPPGADDCCRVSADDCEEEIGCTVTCTWLKIFVYHLPSLSMEWCTYQRKIV